MMPETERAAGLNGFTPFHRAMRKLFTVVSLSLVILPQRLDCILACSLECGVEAKQHAHYH